MTKCENNSHMNTGTDWNLNVLSFYWASKWWTDGYRSIITSNISVTGNCVKLLSALPKMLGEYSCLVEWATWTCVVVAPSHIFAKFISSPNKQWFMDGHRTAHANWKPVQRRTYMYVYEKWDRQTTVCPYCTCICTCNQLQNTLLRIYMLNYRKHWHISCTRR